MIKKRRVNLFSKQKQIKLEVLLKEKLVYFSTIIGAILFIVIIILKFADISEKKKFQELTNEKQQLFQFIIDNKDNEASNAYFLIKKGQLKKFLNDDARFLPYYKVLNDSIFQATASASVQSIVIDKTRGTEFMINFPDYTSMYKFVKYVESDEFLKNFQTLTLRSFSLNTGSANTFKGYQLSFEGQFETLSEKELPL